MEEHKVLGKVSESPTVPGKKHEKKKFDIADLYDKPVSTGEAEAQDEYGLDEKLRKAYFWIANYAIINPFCFWYLLVFLIYLNILLAIVNPLYLDFLLTPVV